MADETKNLKLFKYNTKTDRKEKFSIDDALNDNWDKVDEAVNANKESIAEVKEEVAGIISPPPIEFESGKFLSNDGNKLVWKEVEAGTSEEELALKEDKANKGVANGYAGLNAQGKVFGSQLDLSGKQDVLVPGEGIKIVGNTISSTVTGGANNYEDLVGKPTKLSDFVDDLGNAPVHTHEQYLTQHQDLSGKANVDMSNVSADVLKNLIGASGAGGSGGVKETYISEDKNSYWVWFDNGLLIQQIHIPSRPWAFTVKTNTFDYGVTTYTAVPTPVDWALPKAYSNTNYIISGFSGTDLITAKNSSTLTLKILAVEGNGSSQPTGIPKAVDILTVGYCDPSTT